MPKIATPHWSYHRYFSPLICQSIFPPERTVTPPPLTQHKTFPCISGNRPADESQQDEPVPVGNPGSQVKILIPKPRGEVSRINRGGYNLQEKLGWPVTEYEEIRTFVIQLARDHLVVTKPWSKQKQADLKVVFAKAKERYPQLNDYDSDWVVSDFLRLLLKNTAVRAA